MSLPQTLLHLQVQQILVIDNYDSFTYNLVHLLEKITGEDVAVFRNNEIHPDRVDAYDKIILSPGPGLPSESENLISIIQQYMSAKSILGVCLGHQAIAETLGAELYNLPKVFHGVATPIHHNNSGIFEHIENPMLVGRYHSWVVKPGTLPESIEVTALDAEGNIMAFQHKRFKLAAVQFHPESVLTRHGEQLLRNWLQIG